MISGRNGVDTVRELLTMSVGPESLLVAPRIDLPDGLSASDVETLADEIDRDLRSAAPTVDEVFLDPTGRKE